MGIGIVCLSPRETPDVPCVPTDAFLHWEVEHGGDGWNVEENRCPLEGAEAQTCFVSSFHWCTKWQAVDLLKEGLWVDLLDTYQPEICISDWWCGLKVFGCTYSICVRLLAADQESVIASFRAKLDSVEYSHDGQYHQVSHVFRHYGPGVRYLHFLHKGKDTLFWKGHYGARITNSAVMVKIS
uniref:FBA domain-containing protein n=1 Tax=Sphenodon punctatus TaxID=8508 RepID=A0A8D0GVL1_SPHPU